MRSVRWLLLAVAAAVLVAMGGWWVSVHRSKPPPPLAHIYPATVAAHDHDGALRDIDARIAGIAPLLAAHPENWLEQEGQAQRLMIRARLTGDFADYAAAGTALKTAFANAAPNTGPHMTAAVFALAVHRSPEAARLLSALDRYAIPPEAATRAEAEAMRGDIAFYSGRYAAARAAYANAETIGGGEQAVRRAILLAKTGDPDGARAATERGFRAGRFITAQAAAQLHYQQGLIALARGDWSGAETAFATADKTFSGQWQYQQALAQSYALRGDRAGAIRLYGQAIASANNPETMDALAAFYRAEGDRANAARWAGRAAAIWERWLTLLPEAAYAHALDHELSFGTPARALALAQANWRTRPYGASAVALAWALLANGRAAEAAKTIEQVNASGWVTAEQHQAGAQAYELLGQPDKATAEREAALALNSRAFDRRSGLIWIGH